MSRNPIIIGNWKMHKTVSEALSLAEAAHRAATSVEDVQIGIAPPFTSLFAVAEQLKGGRVLLTAQNCHEKPSGAYTGEVSPDMLQDVGCSHVIIGHSERRQYFGEDDGGVNRKAKAVLAQGMVPVICVGENLAERESRNTFAVVQQQLEGGLADIQAGDAQKIVIAYEPVWAIGTGKTATTEQAQEVHAFLRARLTELFGADTAECIRIQYGGSVKPSNITALMAQPDVDGALVGGASLDAESFVALVRYERRG